MPTKRRKVAHRRLTRLTEPQREHLVAGGLLIWWDQGEPFVDEAHREAVWRHNRERLLAEWDRAGERPAAFWDYEATLPEGMPEPEAVHALLSQGDIAPCTRYGIHRVDDEVAFIEGRWLESIVAAARWTADPAEVRRRACGPERPELRADTVWPVPTWFYEEHAPGILERRRTGELQPY